VTRRFVLSFDYLCPFARNASEHVIAGLRGGADWDVRFRAHSLAQGHVPEGEPPIWERDQPNLASGLLALQIGVAVRDLLPDHFLAVHEALFAARHDEGADIKDPAVIWRVLDRIGLDPEEVFAMLATGKPLATVRDDHDAGVRDDHVWGVPTFVVGPRAVFVRLMDRPAGDADLAIRRIEQVLDLVEVELALHEFKQTHLPV
jgi:hypothetical protein